VALSVLEAPVAVLVTVKVVVELAALKKIIAAVAVPLPTAVMLASKLTSEVLDTPL
jgi:hypothetical protein